jgi:hypothetical protein
MISPLSSATGGIQIALSQFSSAAATVAQGVSPDQAPDVQGEDGFVSATVSMITAKAAFQASLKAAETSNEMLSEALKIGGYTNPAQATA